MEIWGFTIVKNAIKYDYPVVESIRSILPLCDGIIVLHGDSEDKTAELLSQIKSSKLIVKNSVWDSNLKQGGKVLAEETNKAFNLIPDTADWCIYIQADEILHENSLQILRKEMEDELSHKEVKGLLVNYIHFYGSYDFIGKSSNWYKKEIRIIRKDDSIYSYQDAQGFRMHNNEKIPVKETNVVYHHYGWVKNPKTMQSKVLNFHKLWHDNEWIKKNTTQGDTYNFEQIDVLERFNGTHPKVMQERISEKNWNFEYDLKHNKYSVKDRIKNVIRKITGRTPGEYRNYKIIK